MVKLQPSKLIMTVRFCPPAFWKFTLIGNLIPIIGEKYHRTIYLGSKKGVTKEELLLEKLVKICLVDLQGNVPLQIF